MPDTPTSTYARADEIEWVESKPGIFSKPLYEDRTRGESTVLARLAPGARSAPHAHDAFEQIHVLEGCFHDGTRELKPGDHCCRAAGVMHEAYSEHGALVLVIYTPAKAKRENE